MKDLLKELIEGLKYLKKFKTDSIKFEDSNKNKKLTRKIEISQDQNKISI